MYNLDTIHNLSIFHALIFFLFYHHLHDQIPHWAVPAGDWNRQDTHLSPLLSFKHQGFSLCLSFTENTVNPYKVLKNHCSNKMHRLLSTNSVPVVATWESSEILLLRPCISFLFCLILKTGMGNTLPPHRLPSGQTWQYRNGRNPYPSEGKEVYPEETDELQLQYMPLQLFLVSR